MEIYKRLALINAKIGAIGKNSKNTQQNFSYRGIDDVMNELHSFFAENEVIILPSILELTRDERTSKSGNLLFFVVAKINYKFVAPDGSSVDCIVLGEAMDSGDKAINKAMSIALKYALLQMFLIPTREEKDPDGFTHEIVKKEPLKVNGTNGTNYKQLKDCISEPQAKRLFALAKNAGISIDGLKDLISSFGFEHTNEIAIKSYNSICNEIQEIGMKELERS